MPKGIPKNGVNKGWLKKGGKPWNKDTKGVMKPNKTSFKNGQPSVFKGTKGIQKANKTSFKKGIIP